MSESSKAAVQADWVDALLTAFERSGIITTVESATLSKTYAARLAESFVDFSDVSSLSAHEFSELSIPIGHRKVVRSAAANALKQREATKKKSSRSLIANSSLVTGSSSSPSLVPSGKFNSSDPYAVSVSNASQEGLQVNIRKSTFHEITWIDISGSCPTFDAFVKSIKDIMRSVGLHGSESEFLMTGFQDNKPMPFAAFDPSASAQLSVLRLPDLQQEHGTKLAEITNRIVVWWPTMDPTVVLTYHRCDLNPLKPLSDDWDSAKYSALTQPGFYGNVVRCVVRTYRNGLKNLQTRSDAFEDSASSDVVGMIGGMTNIQKQVSVYLRCLTATRDLFDDIAANAATASSASADDGDGPQEYANDTDGALDELVSATASYKISVESLISLASELNENASSSINMQMALDGFRASVNMKIFTYMSVLLQPVAVATGWYGMNFDNMPDLLYEDSYFVFMGIVGGVVFLLILWLVYRSCIASL